MSGDSPYFFLSYAHGDDDSYLRRFFTDLQFKVSQLDHESRPGAFRDSNDLDAGDDWNSKISEALRTSRVLVCIYTARFFSRKYCGKEFAAFLKRNDELRYEPAPDDADGALRYQVREARNIIPILWIGENDLALNPDPKKKLPPHAVRSIQYAIKEATLAPRVAKAYREKGLWRLYVNPRSATRSDIIHYFATQIVKARPLPSPARPFAFEELWDAFSEVPPGHPAPPPPPGMTVAEPAVATPEAVSPRQADMLAIEITPASDGAGRWAPFPRGPALATVVQEIAHDDRRGFSHLVLDPDSEDFEAKAAAAVDKATADRAMPILFVNPRCLKLEKHRSAIIRLVQRKWSGGIILPADPSDREAVRLVQDNRRDLERPDVEGAHIVIRESIGTIDTFRTSVNSVAMQTFARIAEVGLVQRKPSQQEGPDARPRITNFLNSTPSQASRRKSLS
jgi:TIR domain